MIMLLNTAEAYLRSCQIHMMELFFKNSNLLQMLTIYTKILYFIRLWVNTETIH